jgi:hypothetical protein
MQTSATSSTGHDTIDPRYDTITLSPNNRRNAPNMRTMLMMILIE